VRQGAQASKLESLGGDLEHVYDQLLTAAPQAKLVVVGYPRIFASSYKGLPVYQGQSYCILDHYPGLLTVDVGMPASDARAIDRFEVKLDSTIQRATMMAAHPADAARVKYADTYDASVPRNCKGTTPHASVAGLMLSPGFHGAGSWYKELVGSGTFHPTDDGQRMMAGVVAAAFNGFPTPTTPAPKTNPMPGVTINTTPLPSQMFSVGRGPTNAAFDSDGTLWITEFEGLERVGSGGELSYVPIEGEQDDGSGNIVQGPDGNVWFTSLEQVGFVDDLGDATTFDNFGPDEIQAIGLPEAITGGPDGQIWFTDGSYPGSISEINSDGEVTRHIISTPSASWMLKGLTSGPDGALWFTETPFGLGVSAAIGRITTDGEATTWPLPSPASDPFQIVSGPDGALWFTDAGTHTIGRITTGGDIVEYPIPASVDKFGPFGLTLSNGSLWFATATHIGQITTTGQITIWPVTGAQELGGITAASDGTLWVMDQMAGTAYHVYP
jgi:virginiamycin B lyase